AAATHAAEEVIALWPEGPPGGKAPYDTIVYRWPVPNGETDMLRNVSEPDLTVFRPDAAKANGHGVIVAPGGGWRILAWEHEGVDVARWLAARGYTAFLLKYRVMGTHPDPAEYVRLSAETNARLAGRFAKMKPPRTLGELISDDATKAARVMAAEDGRRALAVVRERAAGWGVQPDKVGMIGFSAGAFLTADVAMDPGGAPLSFAAPIYGGETSGKPVPPDAPPLFIAVAVDDRLLFTVTRGLFNDWTDAERPAEMHAYSRGGHGFGMARQGLPSDGWIDAFGDWLVDRGLA
ncbi:MAG TPA: alpha/beta hydrolase, partial [Caulobacteraceae bacterium]|nr:alpha/beta hydrolase [Caulobacteraceae bacterium]